MPKLEPANEFEPMYSTESGMVMLPPSDEHQLKALFPIEVNSLLPWNETLVTVEEPKAFAPIVLTLLGIVIPRSLVSLWKAFSAIEVT